MDADDVALPRWLEATLAQDPIGAPPRRWSGRRRSTCTRTGRSARCTGCPPARARFGGPPSSRRRSSTRPCSSTAAHSSATASATTRRSRESEDYDLWARLLAVADGDNVSDALVLYRRHEAQATARRAELQLGCRRRVALREIEALAPELTASGPSSHGAREAGCRSTMARPRPPWTRCGSSSRRSRRATADARPVGPLRGRSRAGPGERRALLRGALGLDPTLPVVRSVAAGGARPEPNGMPRSTPPCRDHTRLGPADDGHAGADAVQDGDARSARAAAGARPHGPLRGQFGAAEDVGRRARPSVRCPSTGGACRVPTACSGTTTRSRRASSERSASRDRRSSSSRAGARSRLRRRWRGAGGEHAVRPARREQRTRGTTGLAAPREERSRADRRRRR